MTKPTPAQIDAAVEAVRKAWLQRGVGPKALAEAALTAAAEVGDQRTVSEVMEEPLCACGHDNPTDICVFHQHHPVFAATIERCAQVAAAFDSDCCDSREITAAIRALKAK